MSDYYVYIITNKPRGTLYTGITNNLIRRMHEHKNNAFKGFSRKYNLHQLVYYSYANDVYAAISYEKKVKKWRREWKIELIEQVNPTWKDLCYSIAEG